MATLTGDGTGGGGVKTFGISVSGELDGNIPKISLNPNAKAKIKIARPPNIFNQLALTLTIV